MSDPKSNGRSLAPWISTAIVAGAGVLGAWMSYDQGAAVMEQRVAELERCVTTIEAELKDTRERLIKLEATRTRR